MEKTKYYVVSSLKKTKQNFAYYLQWGKLNQTLCIIFNEKNKTDHCVLHSVGKQNKTKHSVIPSMEKQNSPYYLD